MVYDEKQKDTRFLKCIKRYSNGLFETELGFINILQDTIIAFFVILLLCNSIYVNTEYERSLITRFGEIKEVTDPGIHFKIPGVDSRYIADTRMKELTIDDWIATKGGSNRVKVKLIINHSINSEHTNIRNLYKLFGGSFDYEGRFLTKSASDKLKSVVSKHEISSVTDNRDTIRNKVLVDIQHSSKKYGIDVKSVQIDSVQFDPEYLKKLKVVQSARALAAAAKEQVTQAKFLANKKIEQTRGEAESKKLAASAEAFKIKTESVERAASITRIGDANASAIKVQNEAAKNTQGLANLRRAEAMKKWKGNVPQFMSGSSGNGGSIFPFMNVKDMINK